LPTNFYIQASNREEPEDTRGFIEERELAQVLFKARFNKKRMAEEDAREDVRVFLDYIRDRAGILVEKGRNENGENIFAFVHISLTLYKINNAADTEDRQENEALLRQQLAKFKADYPEYYCLIGLQ
jgi:hypothetical protein